MHSPFLEVNGMMYYFRAMNEPDKSIDGWVKIMVYRKYQPSMLL